MRTSEEPESPKAYLELGAGEPVLPGGKLALSGSVGEGCRQGEYQVFQEYWPQPGTTGSTIVEYRTDGAPREGGDQLVAAPDGSFSAVVGVPGDASRSNLYGDRPGEVPHHVWVEVTGCETVPWKRAATGTAPRCRCSRSARGPR